MRRPACQRTRQAALLMFLAASGSAASGPENTVAPVASPPPAAAAKAAADAPKGRPLPSLADPGAAWSRLLAQGTQADVSSAYDVMREMYHDGELTDGCAARLDALDEAIHRVPVGVALWHSGAGCATKAGDAARAARYAEGVDALAAYALSRDSSGPSTVPVSILNVDDAWPLVQATGMDVLYRYHDNAREPRHYATTYALWDAEAKTERHVSFDFLDPLYRLKSTDEFAGYPAYRVNLRTAFVEAQTKEGDERAEDLAAAAKFDPSATGAARFDVLRAGAASGGLASIGRWLAACDAKPATECAGLVDALLPFAEKDLAMYRVQLALAYARGIGVRRDIDAALVLLDSASTRWPNGNALSRFTEDWLRMESTAPPGAVMERLQRAAAAGSRRAQIAHMRALVAGNDASRPLDKTASAAVMELAAAGYGPAQVRAYLDLLARKQEPAAIAMLRKAADGGDADAQERLAERMLLGQGMPRDRSGALALMRKAADSDPLAMQWMGQYSAGHRAWDEAEAWFFSGLLYDNWRALVALLEMYQTPDGKKATPERIKQLYEALVAGVDEPEVRRSYATYLSRAPGIDRPRARSLLEQDAKAGDMISTHMLGRWLVQGKLGAPDSKAGMKLLEASMATRDSDAIDAFANFLYYDQRTPHARARAFEVERDLIGKGYKPAMNTRAWWLCTSEDPALRAPAEGLEVARKMGPPADLHEAYLDTLAACEAANGNFAAAVTHEAAVVEAWEFFPPPGGTGEVKARLAAYRAAKPYIETKADEPD